MLARIPQALLSAVPASLIARSRTSRGGASRIEPLVALLGRPLEGASVTIRHGEARGLRFRAERRSLAWITGKVEPEVQTALRSLLRPGDTFVDVGAGVGFFTVLAARLVGPAGRVIAFEPAPDGAATIRLNAALNGFDHVEVVAAALSDRDGDALLAGAGEPTATLEVAPGADARGRRVPIATLDSFLADRDDVAPAVVKVDVEGHESAVLRGMRSTLHRLRPALIVEMHGDRSFLEALESAGYVCSPIEPYPTLDEAPWWAHVLALRA